MNAADREPQQKRKRQTKDKAMKTNRAAISGKAASAYAANQAQVRELISMLEKRLTQHAADFEKDQTNWGMVGDLGHIAEVLKEIATTEEAVPLSRWTNQKHPNTTDVSVNRKNNVIVVDGGVRKWSNK